MTPHPLIAALLSLLLPGLGQLANRQRAKGVALLCMSTGIWLSFIISRSMVSAVLLGLIYLVVLVPAVHDAFRTAKGLPSPFTGERAWYVIWMLLIVGPFALPLLWQSRQFSTRAKWVWTAVVMFVALSVILLAGALGPVLEALVVQYQTLPR